MEHYLSSTTGLSQAAAQGVTGKLLALLFLWGWDKAILYQMLQVQDSGLSTNMHTLSNFPQDPNNYGKEILKTNPYFISPCRAISMFNITYYFA